MLNVEVQRELIEVLAAVHRVCDAADARVGSDEIGLRVEVALATISRLEAMTGIEVGRARRHLGWIAKRHREGKPELSDGDVHDLREHDLAEVVDSVEKWAGHLMHPELVAAVARSWEAQQYDAAVREAFVHLETRMRELAGDAASGEVGRRLVNRLLPGHAGSDRWTNEGMLGVLQVNEQSAARELLQGAMGLFRNATAHRTTAYTRDEAQDVITLVNLCLRLLDKLSRAPDDAQTSEANATTGS